MYGYYEHIDITPEQLLQKIDQVKIFEWILKQPVIFGNKYRSPFREDNEPKCFFTQREDNTILFIDFGDRTGRTHRSCFRMVMDSYNPTLTLTEAIEVICERFNLSKNSSDYPVIQQFDKLATVRSKTRIDYIARDFEPRDRKYWNKFLISLSDLEEDNVLAAKKFTKINKKGVLSMYPPTICYAIDFIAHVKLYMPYNPELKFITNCDEDDIGNIDNLSHFGDRLIIGKSYKDHRVVRNILNFHDVIWFMNEGCIPSEHILKNLLSRFENIIIFFDNDFTGFRTAYKLYRVLTSLSSKSKVFIRYIPISLKPIKDAGEFVSKEGRKDTFNLLNKILKI